MPIEFSLNGREVGVDDDGGSLLEVLRERLGVSSTKDGCSPQGQCGCCTVLIDGAPRVACVTPARRVAGRAVTTLEGLDPATRAAWADAFVATGASQCGFCTPGIVVRLEGLRTRQPDAAEPEVARALGAHLCRCTGWRTIFDAYARFGAAEVDQRDLAAASRRASLEGRTPQRVGAEVALGRGGFADDLAPRDALVAVPAADGGWALGETLAEARAAAGKVPGRRTTAPSGPLIAVPDGNWTHTLRTSWIDAAYLELDASWCRPGGEPASPLANGGAFGAKTTSIVAGAARELADRTGRTVRVLLAREDVVARGPKRPPFAAGLGADGSGVVRFARTPGVAELMARFAPQLRVEEVDLAGPPTSLDWRAMGWAEAAILGATTRDEPGRVESPDGAVAAVAVGPGGIEVELACGDPLDEVTLRSYAIGAVHMALGWVTTEGISVDADGRVHDLTIRSLGVPRAVDMPPVAVAIVDRSGPPVNGSDATFAATASAIWAHLGFPPEWPVGAPLVC